MKVYLVHEIDDMESGLSKMDIFMDLISAFNCAAKYHREIIKLGDGIVDEEFIEKEREKVLGYDFEEYCECLYPGEDVGIHYTIREFNIKGKVWLVESNKNKHIFQNKESAMEFIDGQDDDCVQTITKKSIH